MEISENPQNRWELKKYLNLLFINDIISMVPELPQFPRQRERVEYEISFLEVPTVNISLPK